MIIAIGLYQGFTTLDAIGPYEVLTYLPDAEVVVCAERTGVVDDHWSLPGAS
jgi:putative intracellular protease/amidase